MLFILLFAIFTTAANALLPRPSEDIFTVEIGPGRIRTVTATGKQSLQEAGYHVLDIADSSIKALEINHVTSEESPTTKTRSHRSSRQALLEHEITLNATALSENLLGLTQFNNRFYKSQTGIQSSEWLLGKIQTYLEEATARGVQQATVRTFDHEWGQKSIIASLKGKGNGVVVLGAHQDSINQLEPAQGKAPGADDNGTGSITILEALRAIVDSDLIDKDHEHSVEFHWYAAEEAGLLGSKGVFQQYAEDGIDVVAMLNFDMTGYVKAGSTPTMGVITDNVDPDLTQMVRRVIEKYCSLSWTDTLCGYECSDHASATRNGFPSAFIFESTFENANEFIHTSNDTIEKVDFGHVYEFAKLAVAAAYELAW
ncbi:hypothetical protein ACHAQA_005717 [Verticillium albo-atrum]